jgi:sn-glycerol 3-phosphate transport system permease protein
MRTLRRALPTHLVLLAGVFVFAFPVYVAFVGSSYDAATIGRGQMPLVPGPVAASNYVQAWTSGSGERTSGVPVRVLLQNTALMALLIAVGKVGLSVLSAYAVVFFDFPFRMELFWLVFITLMLPVEVRIIPTYKVVSDLGLIDTMGGLTVPLMVSATGTLLFRQVFLSVPEELIDAAVMDGAGPLRCLWSIVVPVVRTNIAALFVVLFIYGWNQYLWPLLVTTSQARQTILIGIVRMIGGGEAATDWNLIMATTVMAMVIPVAVIVLAQRWFVRGLVEVEK